MEEPNRFFDAACVITLRRFPQRLADFDARATRMGWPFAKPQAFFGIDSEFAQAPSWWTINQGQWGCLESHRNVIARALSDGVRRLLVMEDDCDFVDGAAARMTDLVARVPDDWDCIMFGSQCAPWGEYQDVADGIQLARGYERMHCYGLTRRGMLLLYQQLSRPLNQPCDYTLGHLQGREDFKVYRAEPNIAIQGEAYSVCEGTRYPARTWDEQEARARDIFSIPLIALKCPVMVARRLIDEGLIYTGYPADTRGYQYQQGVDTDAADKVLQFCKLEWGGNRIGPGVLHVLEGAREYERAVAALWHPAELVPCGIAIPVEAETFEDAAGKIASIVQGYTTAVATSTLPSLPRE